MVPKLDMITFFFSKLNLAPPKKKRVCQYVKRTVFVTVVHQPLVTFLVEEKPVALSMGGRSFCRCCPNIPSVI